MEKKGQRNPEKKYKQSGKDKFKDMDKKVLTEKIKSHLRVLCSEIGKRRVGSEENRQSTAYAEKVLKESGWQTEVTELSVMNRTTDGATLSCNGQSFEVYAIEKMPQELRAEAMKK